MRENRFIRTNSIVSIRCSVEDLLQSSSLDTFKICTGAGLASGAMMARYTRALSDELAVEEFQHVWLV